jgi:hypothetical protein
MLTLSCKGACALQVQALVDAQYARACELVEQHCDKVEALAQELRHNQASFPLQQPFHHLCNTFTTVVSNHRASSCQL